METRGSVEAADVLFRFSCLLSDLEKSSSVNAFFAISSESGCVPAKMSFWLPAEPNFKVAKPVAAPPATLGMVPNCAVDFAHASSNFCWTKLAGNAHCPFCLNIFPICDCRSELSHV